MTLFYTIVCSCGFHHYNARDEAAPGMRQHAGWGNTRYRVPHFRKQKFYTFLVCFVCKFVCKLSVFAYDLRYALNVTSWNKTFFFAKLEILSALRIAFAWRAKCVITITYKWAHFSSSRLYLLGIAVMCNHWAIGFMPPDFIKSPLPLTKTAVVI